jgi:hypothetical protein
MPHIHSLIESLRRKEEEMLRELRIIFEVFPSYRQYHRTRHQHHRDQKNTILFEYLFPNLSILQPMGIAKNNGAFDGALVFKNAAGNVIPISGVNGATLEVDPTSTGTGSVTLNPDGTFSGTGADGDIVLVASAINDKGTSITGTNTITFTAVIPVPDTTAVSIDVNVN